MFASDVYATEELLSAVWETVHQLFQGRLPDASIQAVATAAENAARRKLLEIERGTNS